MEVPGVRHHRPAAGHRRRGPRHSQGNWQLTVDGKPCQVKGLTWGPSVADDLDLAQTARYVKLNLTQRGTGWGYSLWGFGIYG